MERLVELIKEFDRFKNEGSSEFPQALQKVYTYCGQIMQRQKEAIHNSKNREDICGGNQRRELNGFFL